MQLTFSLGDKYDLAWAQHMVTQHHYLHQRVHPRARPMAYVIRHGSDRIGLVMAGLPHATRLREWWGYPELPTQWQVMDLCRIWIDPDYQAGGEMCRPETVPGFTDRKGVWRPAVATWVIRETLSRIQEDRVSLWPPVYLDQPYHIRLVISYHDPQYHKGTIYRQSKARPVYVDGDGRPRPGPSGKYLWAWKLDRPGWEWSDIEIRRPRTLRLF